jgi:hypothetical protein
LNEPPTRPVAIGVIGWGWIAIGLLATFSGVMGMLMATAADLSDQATNTGRGSPFDFVFEHFGAFAAAQVAVGLLVIGAAIALLKRRRWGASVLRICACFGLIFVLGFTAYFLYEVSGMPAPPAQAGVSKGYMIAFFGLGTLFTVVFQGTPLVLTLYFLGRENVRRALQ